MYFLDGYNFLFTLSELESPFSQQRQRIVRFLQKRFALLKIEGLIVFDGRVRLEEESGRSYCSPLEVVYTPKGQSADAYIEERVAMAKNPRLITVVTDDRGLLANARFQGAKTIGNAQFIQWLLAKKNKHTSLKPKMVDTKQNIERLLFIFEQRLQEEEDL